MPFSSDTITETVHKLPQIGSWRKSKHRFTANSVLALRAALASGRPLLVKGEPGIGKSQLARAAAHLLDVPFLPHVIDERSERDDLLYNYDAVSRLAQAQLISALGTSALDDVPGEKLTLKTAMAEERFIRPGVLWWAIDWAGAKKQANEVFFRDSKEPEFPKDWTPELERPCGPVVLIDELDKADPSIPNGLLESLGNSGFQTAQLQKAIELPEHSPPPLVIITTNEERELPPAFMRRCLVLQMDFPKPNQREETDTFLRERARVYWPDPERLGDDVITAAVTDLMEDRQKATQQGMPKPGAAEFLDLMRALVKVHPDGNAKKQKATLSDFRTFFLSKNTKA